jgi:hypothetical protein
MKKLIVNTILVAALVLIASSYSFAAVTAAQKVYALAEGQYMLEMVCTANSLGAVTTSVAIDGLVYLVETQPSATIAPTNLYDLTLVNENSLDIMGGNLANRSDTLTQRASPLNYQAQSVKGKLILNVTGNVVAPAQFTVRIFYFR